MPITGRITQNSPAQTPSVEKKLCRHRQSVYPSFLDLSAHSRYNKQQTVCDAQMAFGEIVWGEFSREKYLDNPGVCSGGKFSRRTCSVGGISWGTVWERNVHGNCLVNTRTHRQTHTEMDSFSAAIPLAQPAKLITTVRTCKAV